jgi:hypothetical protein
VSPHAKRPTPTTTPPHPPLRPLLAAELSAQNPAMRVRGILCNDCKRHPACTGIDFHRSKALPDMQDGAWNGGNRYLARTGNRFPPFQTAPRHAGWSL